jgi:hypothetical protein
MTTVLHRYCYEVIQSQLMGFSMRRKIYFTKQLFTALGLPLRGRWSERKPKLMGSMVQFGVKCLIVDNAQDLSLEHLMYIKELTDQRRLRYGYPFGLCLVTAGRGTTIPLRELFPLVDRGGVNSCEMLSRE